MEENDRVCYICVAHSATRAALGTDGLADVLLDLLCAEEACLAAASLALQRGRRAVPPRVPAGEGSLSPSDCVAARESREAASAVTWCVLEEDVMLGLGAEMRHGGEEGGGGGEEV